MSKPAKPKLEQLPIGALKPDPKNARKHGDRNIGAIKASLERFGQQRPILVDADGIIRAGNGTWAAAKALGWKTITVIRTALQGPEAAAYAIADNRTAELAEWDIDALGAAWMALPTDLQSAAGFESAEIQALIREAASAAEAEQDEIPRDADVPTLVKPGELWKLGDHRLLCGDSTKPDSYTRLLGGGARAALSATDPPYLVDYTGERPNQSGKDWTANYREIDVTDADGFFRALFTNVLANVAPRAAIYCWHAHKRQALIARVWAELGILDHQQVIWVKPTPVFGRVYWHFRHEPCMMGWIQGSQPTHDSNHAHNSVWEPLEAGTKLEDLTKPQLLKMIKDHSTVWEIDWEGKSRVIGNEHPTQKPVEIFARPIRKHTIPGQIVLEPFSGSGSQIIAAEQLGRRCYALEISPRFCDVAIARWEKLTGKTAERAHGEETTVPTRQETASKTARPTAAAATTARTRNRTARTAATKPDRRSRKKPDRAGVPEAGKKPDAKRPRDAGAQEVSAQQG